MLTSFNIKRLFVEHLKDRREGQSIVEILVAVVVVATVLVAVAARAVESVRNANLSRNQVMATRFAQEGMEWTRSQRDRLGWEDFVDAAGAGSPTTFCVLDLADNIEDLSVGLCTDKINGTIFTREVLFDFKPGSGGEEDAMEVLVIVEWYDKIGPHSSRLASLLSRWKMDISYAPGSSTPTPTPTAAALPTSTPTPTPVVGVGIILDNQSVNSQSGGSSLTLSHTTSGNERLMLVGVSIDNNGNETVSSVTYGGTPLVKVGQSVNSDDARTEIWRLIAPSTGTFNVVVNLSDPLCAECGFVVGVATFNGVNQVAPLGTFVGSIGTSSTASVNVNSAVNEKVFDTASCETCTKLSPGIGQTQLWNSSGGSGTRVQFGGGSMEDGASSVNMSWSLDSSDHWSIGAVPIKPM